MRKRLIELLESAKFVYLHKLGGGSQKEEIADYLLSNGVIVSPCKIGQTVWVYNNHARNIYKNTVVSIKINGGSKYKNTISVEYVNQRGETSHRRYTWAQIGKQVFFTEEEAVEALVKGATDGKAD